MPDLIQSLWVHPPLGTMQKLSMKSYLANGHKFVLYSYDINIAKQVPDGVECRDANEIVVHNDLPRFKRLAQFADLFRYQLLYEKGGWWVDLDTVCLKPFNFLEPYVFAAEDTSGRVPIYNNGYLKAPVKAPILMEALRRCDRMEPMTMGWGAMGPQLLTELVGTFDLQKYVKPPAVFNFVPWWDSPRLFTVVGGEMPIPKDAHAVHLWNEMWGRAKYDKETQYPAGSLYEILKQRYA